MDFCRFSLDKTTWIKSVKCLKLEAIDIVTSILWVLRQLEDLCIKGPRTKCLLNVTQSNLSIRYQLFRTLIALLNGLWTLRVPTIQRKILIINISLLPVIWMSKTANREFYFHSSSALKFKQVHFDNNSIIN